MKAVSIASMYQGDAPPTECNCVLKDIAIDVGQEQKTHQFYFLVEKGRTFWMGKLPPVDEFGFVKFR